MTAWMHNQCLFPKFLPNQPYRFGEVGVIRHDHRRLVIVVKGIDQEIASEIDIRLFLLALHHLDRFRSRRWRRVQRHAGRLFQVTAEMDRQMRYRTQGT